MIQKSTYVLSYLWNQSFHKKCDNFDAYPVQIEKETFGKLQWTYAAVIAFRKDLCFLLVERRISNKITMIKKWEGITLQNSIGNIMAINRLGVELKTQYIPFLNFEAARL